jgi:hypothetical protein
VFAPLSEIVTGTTADVDITPLVRTTRRRGRRRRRVAGERWT